MLGPTIREELARQRLADLARAIERPRPAAAPHGPALRVLGAPFARPSEGRERRREGHRLPRTVPESRGR